MKNTIPPVSGVYMFTNVCNGKIYIGSSKNIRKRYQQHIHATKPGSTGNSQVITKALIKYGIDNFTFDVLCECDYNDIQEVEQNYIDTYYPFDDIGYNVMQTARVTTHSDEIKDRLRANSIEKKCHLSLVDFRENCVKGKTYEEIYGEEKGRYLRTLRGQGKGVERTEDDKISIGRSQSSGIYVTPNGIYCSHYEAHTANNITRGELYKLLKTNQTEWKIYKMKGLVPLHDNVLVKIEQEAEKKSAGGIVLTGDSKKVESFGTVLAAGPKADQVTVGDKVLINENTLLETKLDDGTVVRLYKVESVLGIVV